MTFLSSLFNKVTLLATFHFARRRPTLHFPRKLRLTWIRFRGTNVRLLSFGVQCPKVLQNVIDIIIVVELSFVHRN